MHIVELERKTSLTKAKGRVTSACRCWRVSVQPGQGHHCRRRRYNRYDSTGFLRVTFQLIYRHCTGLLEYTWLVWPSTRGVGKCPHYKYLCQILQLYCQLPSFVWGGAENLRGLSHKRGWVKQAENLGASPCKRVLSVRYHCGGWSEEVNSCILILSYMVYL